MKPSAYLNNLSVVHCYQRLRFPITWIASYTFCCIYWKDAELVETSSWCSLKLNHLHDSVLSSTFEEEREVVSRKTSTETRKRKTVNNFLYWQLLSLILNIFRTNSSRKKKKHELRGPRTISTTWITSQPVTSWWIFRCLYSLFSSTCVFPIGHVQVFGPGVPTPVRNSAAVVQSRNPGLTRRNKQINLQLPI